MGVTVQDDLRAIVLLVVEQSDQLWTGRQIFRNDLQDPRPDPALVEGIDQKLDVVEPLGRDVVDRDDQPPVGQRA